MMVWLFIALYLLPAFLVARWTFDRESRREWRGRNDKVYCVGFESESDRREAAWACIGRGLFWPIMLPQLLIMRPTKYERAMVREDELRESNAKLAGIIRELGGEP